MKFNKLLISALIAACCGHAYAATGFTIGNGFINGTTKRVATLSLSALLNNPDTYTITCTLNDTNGNIDYTQVQFELHNADLFSQVTLDGDQTYTPLNFIMMDNKNHVIQTTPRNGSIESDSNIQLLWIGTNGTDKSIPINYSCEAVGSKG